MNGTFRFDPRWLRIKLAGSDEVWECDTCATLSTHNIRSVCPRNRCPGTLVRANQGRLKENHYRILYESTDLPPALSVEEHTAQIESDEARQRQDNFKNGGIHLLSSSTTFKVGVDLGDLEVVFLRNVPPEPFNYTQRVGRAGRRETPGLALTYCHRNPHDLYHYEDPVTFEASLDSSWSEGLLRSLFALMKLDNDVPDHTTISRRKPKLGKVPFYQVKQKTPLHILIDSSGLAVHAGQLRRAPNSRDYRKLHLCVDEQSGEVVAGELTSKRARDSSRVASLVGQIDSPISSARADTAYDASGVYEAIENHSAHRSPRVLIPPRKGALLASGPASSRQRNRNIAAQARLGKRKWHTESGYSKRSKVETTFHRYKAIVGSAMRARGLAAQRVEARIGCKILNTMTALRMPDSEMIG